MACLKFFSGDLPELLNEVIQYFHYDYKTLHSCILVNRLWCRLAIPLLWEDPFSIKSPKNYRFIEIYLSNFSNDDKTKLNEYVIHNDIFPSNTLFNYPKFIQHLDTYKVCNTIGKWITSISITRGQHSNYSMRNINLSASQISNFTNLIFKSFFLIFIKNEVNLHSFGITIDSYKETECFDTTFELILQNTNFFFNIKNLTLDLIEITDNITKFLEFLCSNCNSISSFHFLLPIINNSHPIIEKILSQMIKLQENLKKITFGYDYSTPLSLLLSLKNPNCSNTLNTIIFYSIDFRNINILSELFNHLNVLESIHIVYCYFLDSKFIQQINNVTKPFKLKSLILNHIDELLDPLIQKSGNYLENFRIPKFGLQQLLQPIKLYSKS
uniref:F-box domain-containing protein n=1 Tax=Rhizophagus irregularis (strain DAOM 181602 / DAOM 197198 / MUCL 43194) TaxID=747089 RepID=U9THD6_RHIID